MAAHPEPPFTTAQEARLRELAREALATRATKPRWSEFRIFCTAYWLAATVAFWAVRLSGNPGHRSYSDGLMIELLTGLMWASFAVAMFGRRSA